MNDGSVTIPICDYEELKETKRRYKLLLRATKHQRSALVIIKCIKPGCEALQATDYTFPGYEEYDGCEYMEKCRYCGDYSCNVHLGKCCPEKDRMKITKIWM